MPVLDDDGAFRRSNLLVKGHFFHKLGEKRPIAMAVVPNVSYGIKIMNIFSEESIFFDESFLVGHGAETRIELILSACEDVEVRYHRLSFTIAVKKNCPLTIFEI